MAETPEPIGIGRQNRIFGDSASRRLFYRRIDRVALIKKWPRRFPTCAPGAPSGFPDGM